MHSGPLTNFGGLSDAIKPKENFFTDGCHAISSEVNHQFSTLEFIFPIQSSGSPPCIELKSYAETSDHIIFQTKMCGEIMKEGTVKQNVCTLPRMSFKTGFLFLASLCIIALTFFIVLWVLGIKNCFLAISYFGLEVVFLCVTIIAAVAGAFCFSTKGVNVLVLAIFLTAQTILSSLFIGVAMYYKKILQSDTNERKEEEPNINGKRYNGTIDNEKNTVERTAEEHTVDEEKMKEIIYDSGDEHKFEVMKEWDDANASEHAFEVGMWEESSASEVDDFSAQTDPTKFIEVQYMPNPSAK